ncbi:MAG: DUF362 domain-containing protein [Candidatus Omnitrophica bacterium]|nr:DUF362 domain-containing protein [Candidatus Omnitrophota bacterium]MBU4303201.1 DUF362 domain-containing protein [Candidatus Omnitrophota bacterium]MBU4418924.1 DUF362 domain-containing protein [Candidatus Omnitrophota bacterium]MBU4468249.1 DUF362 domain-containing protein [Candidatus Omnitrophota bacterium]MCG2708685.1 DUF362 domain-containing protein [Candidatus Omnitrophota bacterium]
MKAKVSVVKCDTYEPKIVEQAVRDTVDLLGGIANFIKPGSRVLVKPNLLMSKGPECAITTHPEVVRAVIHLLQEINCKIVVGDGPSVWGQYIENVEEVYKITGISGVCRDEGVQLVNFDKRRMRNKFPLTVWLDECDYLISLPKFKTHEFTLITGAIKNLFGLVSGTYKTELHKNYFAPAEFAKILVDIYQEARPALTIIDGILAMEGDGPATGGITRQLGLLLAGSDCVALDTVMAKIMGIANYEVLTTKEAAMRGLGENKIDRIKIEGEDIDKLNIRPFILPKNSAKVINLPPIIKKIFKSLVRYYPYSLRLKCTRCGHCVKVCPKSCIMLRKSGIKIDYNKCIACFCCQEACPEAAIKVKKSILAKFIGL